MIEEPLISIIVPVYGVEKYLERCVNSLLKQTYKNLEIILVDDGSTDNCPIICDKFAGLDSRVQVIHKKNGGLSSARNCGLAHSNGCYIGFVDSDDWIDCNMYSYLYNLLVKSDADCAQIEILETSDHAVSTIKKERIEIYQGKDILQFYMLYSTKTGLYSVCQCLFKREIVDNVRFREGFINEDIDFKYKALANAKILAVSNRVMYFYYQSVTPTISTGGLKKKDFQLYDAADELYNLTKNEDYGTIAKLGKIKKARTAYSLLAKIAYYGIADKSIDKKETVKKLTSENRRNWGILMSAPIGFKRKMVVSSFAMSYRLTEFGIRCLAAFRRI